VSISGTESGQDGRLNIEVFIVCNATSIPLHQLIQVLVMVAATPRNVARDARAARALIAARAFAISTVYAALDKIRTQDYTNIAHVLVLQNYGAKSMHTSS
jgi:hypothetical protein